jgi:GT2 family glycosyltransferase
MDLSIILVNYKSTQLVLDCIESIYQQTVQHSIEIILVDNDSNDDCQQKVLVKYPLVIFLSMDYNAGFARANNAGIEISKGEYILLLNTDTIILDNAIDKSISLLKQHPDAVGCGVQLLNIDGSTQISGAHTIKGGLNTLLVLPYLGKLLRHFGYRLKTTIPSVQTIADTIEVDWVIGAYILVKKEVLKKSGLLDNDFFMYAEEMEWCSRLRKYGKLLLFADPKVIHFGGGSSGEFYNTDENENGKNLWDKKGRQIIVSNILRIRKQFGIGWFLVIIGAYMVEIPIFFFCLFIDKIFSGGPAKYQLKNVFGYTKNIGILLTFFFKMLANKPYFYKTE